MRLGTYGLCGAALAVAFTLVGCAPKYPKCDNDDQCKDKAEVCIAGQCQECRDDTQCTPKGANLTCVSGRCETKGECTSDPDCASKNMVCRSQKCVPECSTNEDCPKGNKCENQKCVAECAVDVDCGPGRACVNGACQEAAREGTKISSDCRPMNAAPGQVIATPAVPFDFDKYEIRVDTRSELDHIGKCLKEAPQVQVVLEGHADDRGTQEYNLALGEKRAATVRNYLKTIGVDTSRMEMRSKGENEPVCTQDTEECWSKNRRVEFIQTVK